MAKPTVSPMLDVAIVGAGLSGIGTAYWLQRKLPGKSYAILEAREDLGGTWDLFRYPGIRSDSDMFTFGYRFKPWADPQPLSSGQRIMDYLRETATENGILEHIRFGHRVEHLAWTSGNATVEGHWTLTLRRRRKDAATTDAAAGANADPDASQADASQTDASETTTVRARFLSICTGYYSYTEAHRPVFKGEEDYQGRIIQPQFWPQDYDYSGKRIVVVGSGATAVTLVPAMAEGGAEHVCMLQRSPTYIMNLPNRSGLFKAARRVLPLAWAYRLARWQNLAGSMFLYWLSRAQPERVRKLLLDGAAKQLPAGYPVETHFNPHYKPWDQRLCVVPDGDLFRVIRQGQASVVTDRIERFSPSGIQLASGEHLEADAIVLATGLKVRILGGASVSIDGVPFDARHAMVYKGMLISGVPNASIAFGYTNASWTLKTDLTANYVCKLLRHMDRKGYHTVVPKKEMDVAEEPFLDFSAGYIQRALDILPKQGHRRPWRVHQNYLKDMLSTRYGRLNDAVLQFD